MKKKAGQMRGGEGWGGGGGVRVAWRAHEGRPKRAVRERARARASAVLFRMATDLSEVLCGFKTDAAEEVAARATATCKQMLVDRGFDIRDGMGEGCGEDTNVAVVGTRDDEVAHVVFHSEDKVGVKTVRSIVAALEAEGGPTRVILVSASGPTPFTKKEMAPEERIECFKLKELLVNPTRCVLVPPHRLVTDAERRAVEERYGIQNTDVWPRIFTKDPIVRYYNWPVGSLVRIDRCVGGEASVYYRLVVSSS